MYAFAESLAFASEFGGILLILGADLASAVREIGRLDGPCYSTHSMRRTKAALSIAELGISGDVTLAQPLQASFSTVRYLGVETDDGLEFPKQTEV
jgi:hypothetical protein